MSNIDEQYDNLLKMGDKVAEEGHKLTEEEVNKISDALSEVRYSDDDLKALSDLPSNNGKLVADGTDKGYQVTGKVAMNPSTGEMTPVESSDEEVETVTIDGETYVGKKEDYITDSFDDFLEKFKGKEDTPIDINDDAMKSSIKKYFNGTTVEDSDIDKLGRTILKFNNNEYKSNVDAFKDLPQFMQYQIDTRIMTEMGMIEINKKRQIEGNFASEFLSELLLDIGFESVSVDLNNEIDDLLSDADINVDYANSIASRLEGLDKLINDPNFDENKKESLTKIKNALVESYEYNDFMPFAIHTKVKDIELRKPNKVFDNFEYQFKDSNRHINHIRTAIPTLMKVCDLSKDDATAFAILFCKYTKNYHPSTNLYDYVFMYYFIVNLLTLNIEVKGERNAIANKIIENIKKIMEGRKEAAAKRAEISAATRKKK